MDQWGGLPYIYIHIHVYIYIWYPGGTYPCIYTWLSFDVGCGPGERGCLKSTAMQAPTLIFT